VLAPNWLFTTAIICDSLTVTLAREVVKGMEQSLLYCKKERFPGSGVMSRRAFNAVLTKGILRPFLDKIVLSACHHTSGSADA